MRIAVISDTHDHYPPGLPAKLASADEIWHLGDVMQPRVLVEFEQLGLPFRVIMGNCDFSPGWPHSLTLEKEGVCCHLVHIAPNFVPKGVRLVLHGHTHIPRDTTDPLGVRWLNPGCISQPRGGFPPSYGWLELKDGRVERWEIVRI
jgi:putative phosphoesterase